MTNTYKETFRNEYGENWWFDYIPENDMGILWGDDFLVAEDIFYVFDGICPLLILNNEEKEWLTNVWKKHSNQYKNNYLNQNTEVKQTKSTTYLNNDICPICLKHSEEFEEHHCIEASLGGSDDIVNKLRICNSCHALITNGNKKDRIPRYEAAKQHQIMTYGIDFFKMNSKNNKRYNGKIDLYENVPFIREIMKNYCSYESNLKIELDNLIKNIGKYYYKYNRSIVLGFITKKK